MPQARPLEARRRPSWLLAPAALIVFLSGAAALRAQEAVPLPLRESRPAQPVRNLNNLKDGLDATNWDPARRGPLLALEPQSVQPWQPERDPNDWYSPWMPPRPLPIPNNDRGYPIETVAPYFGRKMIRVGSLSVLAPTEMVVLNTRLPKPDPYAGLRRGEKLMLLQASLTDAQWNMLASENGLGASDLTADQRDLFLSVLPNPMRLIKLKAMKGNANMFMYPEVPPGAEANGPRDPRITLTDAQRASARLRMNRQVSLTIPSANNKNDWGTSANNRQEGQEFYQMASGYDWNRPDAFGVQIRDKVPSRLKLGQLDFDAPQLNPVVSLDGAKTVGELMKRIREATRLEIYADGRVAKLGLGGIGLDGSARSGDVLKALAWAITGAYRKVGASVFILTDDVAGIATRKAYISEWVSMGQAMRRPLFEKAREAIRAKKPLSKIGFAKDDPYALDPATMGKIESRWNTWQGRYTGEHMPISNLPDALKKQVRSAIDEYMASGQNSQRPILTDRVNLAVRINITLVIPGMGEVDGMDMGGSDAFGTMLPDPASFEDPDNPDRKIPSTDPAAVPARMKAGGILCVTPQTPQDARAMVELAKKRSLKAVWVVLPTDPGKDKEILSEATRTGRDQGVAVYAVVRLMLAPTGKLPDEGTGAGGGANANPAAESDSAVPLVRAPIPPDRDINVLGETSGMMAARMLRQPEPYPGMFANLLSAGRDDYLLADAPTTVPVLKRRILSVAQTPGLAGVVLRDIAAPGYGNPGANGFYFYGMSEFGYTEAHRLEMIKAEGYDPVDLSNNEGGEVRTELPFFPMQGQNWVFSSDGIGRPDPNFKTPYQAWLKMRYNICRSMLMDLYKAVRPEMPAALSLIVRDMGEGAFSSWYGTWEAADKLPAHDTNEYAVIYDPNGQMPRRRPVDTARKFSGTVYASIVMSRYELTAPYQESSRYKPGTPQSLAASINRLLDDEKKATSTWDGLVLDLSDLPVSVISGLVMGGLAAPKAQ